MVEIAQSSIVEAQSKIIHVRADEDLREEALAVLKCLGLSMSDAISNFPNMSRQLKAFRRS